MARKSPRPFSKDSNTIAGETIPRLTIEIPRDETVKDETPMQKYTLPPPPPERRQSENGGLRQAIDDMRRQLTGIEATLVVIEERQYEHVQAIAALRVQSGVWGALSGLVAAVAALVTTYVLGRN